MSEPKTDGTATLLGVLYPGVEESKLVRKYLGGPEAPMLYEAAEKIASLDAERDKLRELLKGSYDYTEWCSYCGTSIKDANSHATDCELAAALNTGEKK